MTDPHHYLIVPDSVNESMTIEHPPSCLQHGHQDPQRDSFDGSYVCPFEGEAWIEGLETFFRQTPEKDLFFRKAVYVKPGRHAIECWEDRSSEDWDGGLRLIEGAS